MARSDRVTGWFSPIHLGPMAHCVRMILCRPAFHEGMHPVPAAPMRGDASRPAPRQSAEPRRKEEEFRRRSAPIRTRPCTPAGPDRAFLLRGDRSGHARHAPDRSYWTRPRAASGRRRQDSVRRRRGLRRRRRNPVRRSSCSGRRIPCSGRRSPCSGRRSPCSGRRIPCSGRRSSSPTRPNRPSRPLQEGSGRGTPRGRSPFGGAIRDHAPGGRGEAPSAVRAGR